MRAIPTVTPLGLQFPKPEDHFFQSVVSPVSEALAEVVDNESIVAGASVMWDTNLPPQATKPVLLHTTCCGVSRLTTIQATYPKHFPALRGE